MKNFFKKAWLYLVYTKIGKIIASFVWMMIWLGLYNWAFWDQDWMVYVGLAGLIYPIVIFLIMMAYAWVINPIRDWKARKKNKK